MHPKKNLLKAGYAAVFIAFHPECEHCQYEAKSIQQQHKILKNTTIVLFSTVKDSIAQTFSQQYGLDTLQNVCVVADINGEMWQTFGIKAVPTVFIYNAEGKLLEQYYGETKIEAIIKTLNL